MTNSSRVIFFGSQGNDKKNGGNGDDLLLGQVGQDTLDGGYGNDQILGGDGDDCLYGQRGIDFIFGEAGNDKIDGGYDSDFIDGGIGADTLLGGYGNDIIVGGDGQDNMTGGSGVDRFLYAGNLFANGPTTPAGNTGINILNTPDVIEDFDIGHEQFLFKGKDVNINQLRFQKGKSSEIHHDGNVIVLTDPFAAAGAAAKAIKDNNNIKADAGIFVYFNTTLQLSRVVYSKDLSDGGDISVLANLKNQAGQTGINNLGAFSANNFALV
jgi:Ca2+-binding RTX toxin-like protein